MARIATGVVVVLLVLALGAPYVVGAMTERRVRQEVASAPESADPSVSIEDYRRGWFGSDVRLEVDVSTWIALLAAETARRAEAQGGTDAEVEAMLQDLPRAFVMQVDLRHGPFTSPTELVPVLGRTQIRLDPATPGLARLLEELGVDALFELRTTTHLDGSSAYVLTLPPIRWEADSGELVVEFSGGGSTGRGSPGSGRIAGQAAAERLAVRGDDGSVAIEGMRGTLDGRLHRPSVFIGESRSAVARVAVEDGDSDVEIGPIEIRSSTGADDAHEELHFEQHWSVGAVSGVGDVEVRNATMELRLENLDTDLVRTWAEVARKLRGAEVDSTEGRAALARLEPVLGEALRRGPALTLGPARLDWNEAPVAGTVSVRVDGGAVPADFGFANAMALIPAIRAEGDLTLPPSIALAVAREQAERQARTLVEQGIVPPEAVAAIAERQAGQILDQLVQQRIVDRTAEGYRTRFAFDRNGLSVNGLQIPLGAFF